MRLVGPRNNKKSPCECGGSLFMLAEQIMDPADRMGPYAGIPLQDKTRYHVVRSVVCRDMADSPVHAGFADQMLPQQRSRSEILK